jgi:hypothetical protein
MAARIQGTSHDPAHSAITQESAVRSQTSAMSHEDELPGMGKTLGLAVGVSVFVTRAPDEEGVLRCDGDILAPQRPPACSARTGTGTIRPGERFTDPASGLEVVCTRPGSGTLTFADRPLQRMPWPRAFARRNADRLYK